MPMLEYKLAGEQKKEASSWVDFIALDNNELRKDLYQEAHCTMLNRIDNLSSPWAMDDSVVFFIQETIWEFASLEVFDTICY